MRIYNAQDQAMMNRVASSEKENGRPIREGSIRIVDGGFQVPDSGGDHDSSQNSQNNVSNRYKSALKSGETSWKRNTDKKVSSPDNSMNRSVSVSFATGTSFDERDSTRRGPGRVAQMKAKLRDSMGTADMDASWGGALAEMDDLSMSSSDDDDSCGDDDMDASANFRARARRESVSFNMSFMQVGEVVEDDMDFSSLGISSRRRRNTGSRSGSIFVIPDDKFGQTKVVQTRLEKAAKNLQRFFRRCLLVLRKYTEERDYLKSEIVDIEARRVEELAYVQQFIQEEKELFRMQLEQEWSAGQWTPEEWEDYQMKKNQMKEEIAALKVDNEQLKKDMKEVQRENTKLAIVDPERENEENRLQLQVNKLTIDNADWERIGGTYKQALEEAERKIEEITDKRKIKRAHRKRMEKIIAKITKMLEEGMQVDPKLVEKVQKLKAKREKKMKKLKAKTQLELQGGIAGLGEIAEETTAPEPPKERRRSSRRAAADDLPDLLETPSKEKRRNSLSDDLPDLVVETPKEKRRSSRKNRDEGLPGLVTVEEQPAAAPPQISKEQQEAAKKEKKKKKKEKKKDKKQSAADSGPAMTYERQPKKTSSKARRESAFEGDSPALMMILQSQNESKPLSLSSSKKKAESNDDSDDETPQAGALMSLITG